MTMLKRKNNEDGDVAEKRARFDLRTTMKSIHDRIVREYHGGPMDRLLMAEEMEILAVEQEKLEAKEEVEVRARESLNTTTRGCS